MDKDTELRKQMAEAAMDRIAMLRDSAMAKHKYEVGDPVKSANYRMLGEASELARSKVLGYFIASDFTGALNCAQIEEIMLHQQHESIFVK